MAYAARVLLRLVLSEVAREVGQGRPRPRAVAVGMLEPRRGCELIGGGEDGYDQVLIRGRGAYSVGSRK